MVYLYKWATTVSEGDKKIIFIIYERCHSYICNLNICKNEALEKNQAWTGFEIMTSPKPATLENILNVLVLGID